MVKHLSDDAADKTYDAVVQDLVQKAFVAAKANNLCPDCLLGYIAAFCAANKLLREGAIVGDIFDENTPKILAKIATVAMGMAVELSETGTDWEPGMDVEVTKH